MTTNPDIPSRWREDHAFWALVVLIGAAFLLGGSPREDVLSLPFLRATAAICLAIGLFGLSRAEIARFRGVLIGAVALIGLVALHLVPLPPAIWTALPGREVLVEAARTAGIDQPWRPISMVPWRGWNTLYSLLVPVAALILAIRCTPQQRERLPAVILIFVLVSVLVAVGQVAGGYRAALQLYRISSENVPTGLFANRNHFAAILCCSVPLLVILVGGERGGSRFGTLGRWLAGVAAACGFLLLLMTGSRAGLLLAPTALALALLCYQGREDDRDSQRRRRFLIITVVALIALVVIALAAYLARAEAVERLFADSNEPRFSVWGPIANLVGQYFPVGSGVGSFVEIYRMAEPRELLDASYLNHAHSDWLEWPLETGLPGILLLAAAVAGWAWRSVQVVKLRPDRRNGALLARGGAIILFLLGLASLVDYPLRTPAVAVVAAIAAVWLSAALTGRGKHDSGVEKGT